MSEQTINETSGEVSQQAPETSSQGNVKSESDVVAYDTHRKLLKSTQSRSSKNG